MCNVKYLLTNYTTALNFSHVPPFPLPLARALAQLPARGDRHYLNSANQAFFFFFFFFFLLHSTEQEVQRLRRGLPHRHQKFALPVEQHPGQLPPHKVVEGVLRLGRPPRGPTAPPT